MRISRNREVVSEKEAVRRVGINALFCGNSSFAVVAVRCNSAKSTGKRKLIPGKIYYFLEGYSLDSENCISEARDEIDVLYDDYLMDWFFPSPHIIISAIVGQNGSGKSSIVEFMMRLINNFAAATFGELPSEFAARLHFIGGVEGDLWYECKGILHQLSVKGRNVELFRREKNEMISIFSSEKDCNEFNGTYVRTNDETIKSVFSEFFYTLVSNYSIYAYNTHDYAIEDDSSRKSHIIFRKNEENRSNKRFNESRNWIDGLFHKNDSYQIPLVITPAREEGNIDINNENSLAKERLISLLIKHRKFQTINGHLKADSLTLSVTEDNNYGYDRVVDLLDMTNLTPTSYKKAKCHIVRRWLEKAGVSEGKRAEIASRKRHYGLAADYLTYKTFKIASRYRQHNAPFRDLQAFKDGYNAELIDEIIESECNDGSNTTRKIFQTLAYLLFDVYEDTDRGRTQKTTMDLAEIDRRSDNVINSIDESDTNESIKAMFVSEVPPPFLNCSINLHEISDRNVRISFESLSSGEKQLSYAVSSILYHIDNINSLRDSERNRFLIPYRNLLVVLEEIELYFHPEMQQQFIRYLLDGIRQLGIRKISNIHFLLVTHSPYVLSDIPKQNVLALENDGVPSERRLNTFCGNIHEMLKDSFFLSHGSQGYFAQWEVGRLLEAIDIHRRYKAMDAELLMKSPLEYADMEDSYTPQNLIERYTARSGDNEYQEFRYDIFCKDFSIAKILKRIDIIDEPLIRGLLLRELQSVADDREDERMLKIRKLEEELRQLKESK